MGKRNRKEYLEAYKIYGSAGLPAVPDPEPALASEAIERGIEGRVKFFSDSRKFGFITASDRREFFFHKSSVLGSELPICGVTLTFDTRTDPQGRLEAFNIVFVNHNIAATVQQGRVRWWGQEKCFGYIHLKGASGEGNGIFFHLKSIVPDARGHRCRCMQPSTPVEFVIHHGSDGRDEALNVRSVKDDGADEDAFEFSQVIAWNGQFGFLRRACGESDISFRVDQIVTTGAEEIAIGDYVKHKSRLHDGSKVFATEVHLFEPGFVPEQEYPEGSAEAFFASIPDESEPQPAPSAPEAEPQIYSPEDRKLSLRALINRKKAA